MSSRTVTCALNGRPVSHTVEGETGYGADTVLLAQDDDLTHQTPWHADGYVVAPLFENPGTYNAMVQGLTDMVAGLMQEAGIPVPSKFTLEAYHRYVTDEQHAAMARLLQPCFSTERFPIDAGLIAMRVGELLGGIAVTYCNPRVSNCCEFCLRIIRPGKPDNNPPHRDVWLDHLRDAVNIYVPLAGSTAESALPLVPGSHLWMESEIERTLAGAKMAGQSYRVPSVVGGKRALDFVRPNPQANEVMVFSPYLIHGGGVNFQPDTTRVSLEARFWRKT